MRNAGEYYKIKKKKNKKNQKTIFMYQNSENKSI